MQGVFSVKQKQKIGLIGTPVASLEGEDGKEEQTNRLPMLDCGGLHPAFVSFCVRTGPSSRFCQRCFDEIQKGWTSWYSYDYTGGYRTKYPFYWKCLPASEVQEWAVINSGSVNKDASNDSACVSARVIRCTMAGKRIQ